MTTMFIRLRRKLLTVIAGKMQVGINLEIEGALVVRSIDSGHFYNIKIDGKSGPAIRFEEPSNKALKVPFQYTQKNPTNPKKGG